MALYDFKCEICGEEVELNVPIAERDNDYFCEECSGSLRRKLANPRPIFKGKGFPGNDAKPWNEGTD